jgi:hypothetical protein
MAHQAKVVDGIVTEVIVAESSESCEAIYGGTWVQTSYNTFGNKYLIDGVTEEINEENPDWVDPGYPNVSSMPRYFVRTIPKRPLHKNFAGIGYHWDGIGFYAPQPYASWKLNQDTYLWEAPTPYPTDGLMYQWVEADLNWQAVILPTE